MHLLGGTTSLTSALSRLAVPAFSLVLPACSPACLPYSPCSSSVSLQRGPFIPPRASPPLDSHSALGCSRGKKGPCLLRGSKVHLRIRPPSRFPGFASALSIQSLCYLGVCVLLRNVLPSLRASGAPWNTFLSGSRV